MKARPSFRLFLRRFARAREGVAAVEFALVSLPFFFMLYAIIEVAFLFSLDSALEHAMYRAAREIRTGQVQNAGTTAAQFRERICENMSLFATQCSSRLFVDVRILPRFTAPNPPTPTTAGFPSSYQPGNAGDIVLVRVWYKQPLFTTFLTQALARYGGSDAVLTVTTSFRNEPFGAVNSLGGTP